mmetsp:Transcript_11472/g.17357  ORF Transcript_11472/g.17357 Transcript_11472/m.17357 type:complete len:191 (-) Transcript_11472:12-584(-)
MADADRAPVSELSPSEVALHRKLLEEIMAKDVSKCFHEVNPSISEEYRTCGKAPYSFADIRSTIDGDGYLRHADFMADVEQIFDNAIKFYGTEDPMFQAAHELRSDWEGMLIEADLMEGDADAFMSEEFSDEESEEISDDELCENFQSLQEKMMEDASLPLTDVIDRLRRENQEVDLKSASEVDELDSDE